MGGNSEYTFISNNGETPVYVRRWSPSGPPRAVVQIAHGLREHSGCYSDFAERLTGAGYAVVANDHLGHGKSCTEDTRGYFAPEEGWMTIMRDMREVCERERESRPDLPYFMFGHSMGSFLLRTYLCNYLGGLSGAILAGTGQLSDLTLRTAKGLVDGTIKSYGDRETNLRLYDILNGLGGQLLFEGGRTPLDWVSRDPGMVDRELGDPMRTFTPSIGMFRDIVYGLEYIKKPSNLERMDKGLPVYFMSGDHDPVGSNGRAVMRVYSWFVRHGCEDVTLRLYPGARHELTNEINRERITDELIGWIDSRIRIGGAPVG